MTRSPSSRERRTAISLLIGWGPFVALVIILVNWRYS